MQSGQSHLIWDADIAEVRQRVHEGQAQGLPLPEVERNGERRAWPAEGRHKACPYRRLRGMGRGDAGEGCEGRGTTMRFGQLPRRLTQ